MPEFKVTTPVFKQIEEIFAQNIQIGTWPIHSKVKDEITLAQEYGVSRGTLRKAIKNLVAKGVLTQIRGKGTFVVSSDIQQPLASRLISFAEALGEQSLSYKTVLIKKEVITPDLKVSSLLEIPREEKVIYIERVRFVDNRPVVYLKNFIQLSKCPDIMNDDLENNTLFSLIENKYKHTINWGRRYFKAVPALNEVACAPRDLRQTFPIPVLVNTLL